MVKFGIFLWKITAQKLLPSQQNFENYVSNFEDSYKNIHSLRLITALYNISQCSYEF